MNLVFNHEKRFVFLQNPKCASTYIETALINVPGGEATRTDKHCSIRKVKRRIPQALQYKIFATTRNPLTFYPSLYSFFRKAPRSHSALFFPADNFDDYLNLVLHVKVCERYKHSFRSFTGTPLWQKYSYGWATFSSIHWLTRTQNFSTLEDNRFVKVFRIEDDFQQQISEWLEVPTDIWPDRLVNSFEHTAQLTPKQRELILERDRPVFEKWYPEYL